MSAASAAHGLYLIQIKETHQKWKLAGAGWCNRLLPNGIFIASERNYLSRKR